MDFLLTLVLAGAILVAIVGLVAWLTGSEILSGIAALIVLGALIFGGFGSLQGSVRGWLPPPAPPMAAPVPPATPYVAPTQAPASTAAPAPTSAPAPTVAPSTTAQPVSTGCRVINDYGLELKPEVATSGSHLHVEYWWNGQPERETLLSTTGVPGGRFILQRSLKGHVWEYQNCTDAEVMAQISAHIQRRLAGKANNAGYVDFQSTGLFKPAAQ